VADHRRGRCDGAWAASSATSGQGLFGKSHFLQAWASCNNLMYARNPSIRRSSESAFGVPARWSTALPRNAAEECPYYFWNGHSAKRAVAGIAERTLAAVFKKSAVKNARPHRYRHTLATQASG
jgi:hypothetical protein